MRVMHVIGYFQPKVGYQEYYLAKQAQTEGDQVIVVTSDRYYPFPDYKYTFQKLLGSRRRKSGLFEEEGIMTLRLNVWFELGSKVILHSLNTAISQFKPDLIIKHGLYDLNTLWIAKTKGNFIFLVDDHVLPRPSNVLKKGALKIFTKLLIPKISRQIDAIFTTTPYYSSWLRKKIPQIAKRVYFIPLGVDTSRFKRNSEARNKVRSKLNIPKNTLLLVNTGKISPTKGIVELIKIGTSISESGVDVRVLLVGSGHPDYIKKLRIYSQKQKVPIYIQDPVKHTNLLDYFSAADFCLWLGTIPSASKYEALSCGTPIVLSDSFHRDFVANISGGKIHSHGGIEETGTWILDNWINQEKWEKLSSFAREVAIKHFDWSLTWKKIKILQNHLEANRLR